MNLVRSAVAGLCLLLLSGVGYAATLVGDNVIFTYDDSTLYGEASVVGDTIFFQPVDFIAESLNGGSDTAEAMLNIQVQTINAGYWLKDFSLAEFGDYELIGTGASADVSGEFAVSSNTITKSDTVLFDAGPLTVIGAATEWNTGAMIDLADTAGWGVDTDVDIDITNTLAAATTNSGELSRVQKKLGGVGLTITAVPVPAAVWLFGSGLLGLAGFARRRTAA